MAAALASIRSARRDARWWLAVAVSVGVHLLVLAAFVLGLRIATAPAGGPAIDVELTRPWTTERRPAPARAPRPARTPTPAAGPLSAAAAPSDQPPAATAPVSAPAATGALSGALKGTLGCGHAAFLHLTVAEQRACEGRLAGTSTAAGAPAFGLDPATRLAFDAAAGPLHGEWMSAMPVKGCRPRSTLKTIGDPAHAQHDVTIGVTCVIRF